MNETSSSPEMSQIDWRRFMRPKYVLIGIATVLGVLFVLSVFNALRQSTFGVIDGTSELDYFNSPQSPSSFGTESSYETKSVVSRTMPVPYPQSGGTGLYDENTYKARSYSASIRTGSYDAACDTIEAWEVRPDIVFEQSSRSTSRATYRFKVTQASADEVLAQLKALDPADLTEQAEVVKKQLMVYTSELDVLNQREQLLLQTLTDVNRAYDELVTLSKNLENVKTLATVIDDKLRHMRTLSEERIQVSQQIAAIARQKADLMDRVEFVTFNVSVYRYVIFDWSAIKDGWVRAVQSFVDTLNETLQQMTIGLLTFVLWLVKILFFAALLLIVVKYGWKYVVAFWRA